MSRARVNTINDAYDEGYQAALNGVAVDEVPAYPTQEKIEAWARGHFDARDEEAKGGE